MVFVLSCCRSVRVCVGFAYSGILAVRFAVWRLGAGVMRGSKELSRLGHSLVALGVVQSLRLCPPTPRPICLVPELSIEVCSHHC